MLLARLSLALGLCTVAACGEVVKPGDPDASAVDGPLADAPPGMHRLTVEVAGAAAGRVTSTPAGIDCGDGGTTCTLDVAAGTSVTLTSTPAVGAVLESWSGGGCAGNGSCVVVVNEPTTVTATYAVQQVTLTVAKAGPGEALGTVTSDPAGISCGQTCSITVPYGTAVTLTNVAGGSRLAGWSGGGCSGAGSCAVTVTADTTVTAQYRFLQVAIEASPTSCVRGAGNAIARLQTLLTNRGHAVTVVDGTMIGTVNGIAAYDVVAISGPGSGCAQQDFAAFDGVVDGYVRNGGGLVGSGWLLYSSYAGAGLQAALPSSTANNFLSSAQTVTPQNGHPISQGLGAFTANQYLPWGSGPKPGATVIATVGQTNVAEAWTRDQGRSVFLGPMFLEDYAAYDNESLLDGTQPPAVELMVRAVEWAGQAR